MAATTSNATPRKNGFDFAALSASAGKQDSGDEVARLRAALETLSELVIAHGVMDARTLQVIVGDLIPPPMTPVALSAPLPPPAPSAAEAVLKGGAPRPAAVATAPVAARPAPVAARPAPVVAAAPAPAPAPVAAKPAPVAAAAPVISDVVLPSTVQPVVASPFPSEPAPTAHVAPAPRKNPFDANQAARLEAELTDLPPPALKPQGLLSRLFGKPKTSPAAVAKAAASVEFTERMVKSPFEGLYSEQQRATELSFPPPTVQRSKPRAAAPAKKAARPADAAPARFCDRCWRRMDQNGNCKTCSASPSA